ncbi:MAG: Glu/Leu/Phe/Val dehydrogenase [Rhodospirillaceae bacterium]|nr:Glu/Leu/Phe/Val dehydrogenase [Rhodospirillaceae bacterium]
MCAFHHPSFDGHESVTYAHDPAVGLTAIIAIHSRALGPAAGGCRMAAYPSTDAALNDVLRLSRGMTYKNAMAGLALGGGKSVIIGDPATAKTPALLEAYARAVDRLGGAYYAAEDMGIGAQDVHVMGKVTRFVAGRPEGSAASGDPSPVTARGVFLGIRLAVRRALGRDDLAGIRVAVQGLGNVGFSLCRKLRAAGADLVVADVRRAAVDAAVAELGAIPVSTDEIFDAAVDVFAPCAGGAILTGQTVGRLNARIVAGAANNQLLDDACGQALRDRGILYLPDYVINGGGIINVAAEIAGRYDPSWVEHKLQRLMTTLDEVVGEAGRSGLPTNIVADRMAERRIASARQRQAA